MPTINTTGTSTTPLGAAAPSDYSLVTSRYSLLDGGPAAAFTLVELLVTIAIIAILTTITVPIIGKAIDASRDSQCRTNLRQLHSAIIGYAADTGKLPQRYSPSSDSANNPNTDPDPNTGYNQWFYNIYYYLSLRDEMGNGPNSTLHWPEAAKVYQTSGRILGIFRCPSDSLNSISTQAEYDALTSTQNTNYRYPSYLYNLRLMRGNSTETASRTRSTTPGEVINNCVLLIDGCGQGSVEPKTGSLSNLSANSRYRHNAPRDYDLTYTTNTTQKSSQHLNALLFDGTITKFPYGTLPDTSQTLGSNNGTKLWNPW